ncbi:hypothetical protein Nit79A3_3092 [Nitrosomonas sp. Is79A3]
MIECMNNPTIGHLLTIVGTTSSNAMTVFNMFITVAFGSFAFATGLPMKNIGRSIKFFNFGLSTTSITVGFSLLAFYIISFISFNDFISSAVVTIKDLHRIVNKCGEEIEVIELMLSNDRKIFGIYLASFGFIVGSAISWIVFLWIANADRKSTQDES